MTKKSRVELVIFVILLVILTIFLGLYFYLQNKKSSESPVTATVESDQNREPVLETTPVIKPLPSGRQEYLINHGPGVKGPKPSKVIVDPLTPDQGETQTLRATITSDAPISQASIILHTDNKQTEYQLKLISGDDSSGIWEAGWTMNDSYDYNYYLQFLLRNNNGTFNNGLRFRQ